MFYKELSLFGGFIWRWSEMLEQTEEEPAAQGDTQGQLEISFEPTLF